MTCLFHSSRLVRVIKKFFFFPSLAHAHCHCPAGSCCFDWRKRARIKKARPGHPSAFLFFSRGHSGVRGRDIYERADTTLEPNDRPADNKGPQLLLVARLSCKPPYHTLLFFHVKNSFLRFSLLAFDNNSEDVLFFSCS